MTATHYNDKVVRQFAIMTVVWGIVGMLVGVLIAAQLLWPDLLPPYSFLSFARLRPLHTNAVIFDKLAAFTFWGWQVVILLAAITLPLGMTSSKEYAELEWPIDILIAIVWVAYGVVFFGTIAQRKVKHIYVANWFFAAYIITIAVLHIVNSLAIPVTLTKSYSIYPGVVDAMVQWPPGVQLSPVHCALLGTDLHLHVGWPAPPALHDAARLGAVARHGVLADPARTVVGRHDQRHDDPLRRLA